MKHERLERDVLKAVRKGALEASYRLERWIDRGISDRGYVNQLASDMDRMAVLRARALRDGHSADRVVRVQAEGIQTGKKLREKVKNMFGGRRTRI